VSWSVSLHFKWGAILANIIQGFNELYNVCELSLHFTIGTLLIDIGQGLNSLCNVCELVT
jgi:hypothetical protein